MVPRGNNQLNAYYPSNESLKAKELWEIVVRKSDAYTFEKNGNKQGEETFLAHWNDHQQPKDIFCTPQMITKLIRIMVKNNDLSQFCLCLLIYHTIMFCIWMDVPFLFYIIHTLLLILQYFCATYHKPTYNQFS